MQKKESQGVGAMVKVLNKNKLDGGARKELEGFLKEFEKKLGEDGVEMEKS